METIETVANVNETSVNESVVVLTDETFEKFKAGVTYSYKGQEFTVTKVESCDNASPNYHYLYKGAKFCKKIGKMKEQFGCTFKKLYNIANAPKDSNTKVVIKTDDDIRKTAESDVERLLTALKTFEKIAVRNGYTDGGEGIAQLLVDCVDKNCNLLEKFVNYNKEKRDKLAADQSNVRARLQQDIAALTTQVNQLTCDLSKYATALNLTALADTQKKLTEVTKVLAAKQKALATCAQ